MIISENITQQLNSPVRTIKARVELFEGSTLVSQYSYQDALKNFTVDRVGEGKFFGFGICQRLNVHLLDINREINVSTANNIEVSLDDVYPLPKFYVTEVHRDEITNEASITAYDALYQASERYVSELGIKSYTIREFTQVCSALLGTPLIILMDDDSIFDTSYEGGANFEGTETIRDALNDVAEVTQTIYYIDNNNNLVFKRLDKDGEPVATIDKEKYFSLNSGDNRRLATICSATQLGDNISSSVGSYTYGKNLIPYPYDMSSRTALGIDFVDVGDGSVTLNGTATSGVQFEFVLTSAPITFPLGSYYFHAHASDYTNITCWVRTASGAVFRDTGAGVAVNLSRELGLSFYVAIAKGKTVENVTVQPQFEAGTAATDYEIYTKTFIPITGSTQYLRDNAFLELYEGTPALLDSAIEELGRFTINQFDCSWRGNYLIEIGDKIAFITKDNQTIYSYLLDDTIKYDGSFSQKTQWMFDDAEGESPSNPTSLGELLKQTYAKVDKQKKEIEILASESGENKEQISQLLITTDAITSSVTQLQQSTEGTLEEVNANLVELNTKTQQTAEELSIYVNKVENAETTRVTTTTGFTFNEEGLRVSKTDSEMSTLITEDGMSVHKKSKEVLTANHEGVKAVDLHATTYLIIGDNSRFEDYGSSRTACFWIGG